MRFYCIIVRCYFKLHLRMFAAEQRHNSPAVAGETIRVMRAQMPMAAVLPHNKISLRPMAFAPANEIARSVTGANAPGVASTERLVDPPSDWMTIWLARRPVP
jgi:hypothetical protein